MPDPVREAGETARSVIEAFRAQPLLLASILTNMALLGFLYYTGVSATNERHRELELLYENRKFVGQLLSQCYPAPPR